MRAATIVGAALALAVVGAEARIGMGVSPRLGKRSKAGVPLDLYERHAAGHDVGGARMTPVARRSPAPAAPTNEAQEAQIKSETEACTPYSIPGELERHIFSANAPC